MKSFPMDADHSPALQGKNILLPWGLGSCSVFLLSTAYFLGRLEGPRARETTEVSEKVGSPFRSEMKASPIEKNPCRERDTEVLQC